MAILFDEVKYYKSEKVDFDDPSNNGMGPGDQIVNDTLNSIFPEVSATDRENGLERIAKVFVSNESSDRLMAETIFYLKQDVFAPDMLTLYEATESEYISFKNQDDLDGGTTTVTAGTEIFITDILPDTNDATSLVGRKIQIGSLETEVATAPTSSSITLSDDINFDVAAGTKIETIDMFDYLESDEDFTTAKVYANVISMGSISSGTTTINVADSEVSYFEVGDNIVLVDQYFRVIHRTTITDIQQNTGDPSLYDITMAREYDSTYTVPANQGYIANGFKQDLPPGRMKSLWLKLKVQPSNAIDTEVINQFQLGVHFDDIEA